MPPACPALGANASQYPWETYPSQHTHEPRDQGPAPSTRAPHRVRLRKHRYISPPAASKSADATSVHATSVQFPAPTADAVIVEVTMEGMRPNVAIRTTGRKRMFVSPAKYVRKSLGVPGIRNTTSMISSRRLALFSQEKRSKSERSKNRPTSFQPQRRVAQ